MSGFVESGSGLRTEELEDHFHRKYGQPTETGWGPRARFNYGYFTPSDYYETYVNKRINDHTSWLDVGCGRSLFSSDRIAAALSQRCRLLVGLDPDDTVAENPYVHERVNSTLRDYRTERTYDLVTLNMVAEHITDPAGAVQDLARLTAPGGEVVIFTVFKWSPIPIATNLIPFRFHHWFKHVLWGSEEKDTFPVAYKMNTRKSLYNLFEGPSFTENHFAYLDDCRTLQRFKALHYAELALQRTLRAVGLHYPEVCVLATYKRL